MRLVVLESGYRAYSPDRWCLREPGAARTLCDEPVDYRQMKGRFYDAEDALRPTNLNTCCTACFAAALTFEEPS